MEHRQEVAAKKGAEKIRKKVSGSEDEAIGLTEEIIGAQGSFRRVHAAKLKVENRAMRSAVGAAVATQHLKAHTITLKRLEAESETIETGTEKAMAHKNAEALKLATAEQLSQRVTAKIAASEHIVKKEVNREQKISSQARSAAKQKEDEQGYADVAAHTKEKSEFAARQLSETEAKDARAAASRSSASAEVAHKHAASEVRREQKAEEVAAKARQAADHAKDGYPAGVEAAPKEVIVKQVEAKRVEMEIAHKLAVVAAKRAAIAKFDADKASQQAAKEQNVKKTKSGAVPLNATLAKSRQMLTNLL